MARHHNLGTVIWFEFTRTIKKKSFWIATLSFPFLIAMIFAIVFYSGKTTSENENELVNEKFSITYLDESGVITPQAAEAFGATPVKDKVAAIKNVKNGTVDSFFYYPNNLHKNSLQTYGKDTGLFKNNRYSAVAEEMLKLSANTKIDSQQLVAIARGNVTTESTTYLEDGEESKGWMSVIPPLIFLVLFYFTVAMLGNNLLNSTVEEKENRVTEMILTTLNPTDLIVGKLVATFMAGIVQAILLLVPIVIAYFTLGGNATSVNLPDLAMVNDLSIDPLKMLLGFLIFIGGMMLFTGTLVAIGAVMPTAKEAGQYFGIAILLMFIPFYILTMILSDPESLIVQVFTYFPYTSPVTAMMRNAFGSLSLTEAVIVISELIILGVIIIRLAVHLFHYGAMQYDAKLSLKTIFSKPGK